MTEFFSAKNTKGRFPWLFNEDAQRNFKFYTQLRYRLLPFRYSNAQIAYHESPVIYSVCWWRAPRQIIVGSGDSELLVAPVHVQGATSRQVQLPAGAAWINYWTGEVHDGGASPTVDAPLDKVPMFVKAGSVIPMGPENHYVDEKPADTDSQIFIRQRNRVTRFMRMTGRVTTTKASCANKVCLRDAGAGMWWMSAQRRVILMGNSGSERMF